MIKIDLFGKPMVVMRQGEEWQLFRESEGGLRSRVHEVVFPPEMAESELCSYLDDLFHEYASERHPRVTLRE
ncbi:hypothetical protein FCL40_06935 [Ferrimonas sediminicola]|uniref:DUF7661 domain-containing protein n=1 Tax=Ferrimonas sediminicola TaxID=2569538 RepID=A0A4U1BGP2_9GAMM|nr:hypothetical protein [Ferrimonas sediminicola]TKB49882.1 hypothetical protein FCL40_06935 [Ferrimonas sediminicola]